VLEHEPGQGQKAFAPNRRDMTQHRLDTEKRRLEKAAEREARQTERQRLAAEAAEDLLQEVEEAGSQTSDHDVSDSEAEKETSQAEIQGSMAVDGLPASSPVASEITASDNTALSEPPRRQTMPSMPRPPTSSSADQQARSLHSRLPPQLAAMRLALPARPFGHDLRNAIDGSAIDDDDGTPASEEPPLLPSTACTSYFTEPLSWMKPQLENGDISGKLICPNTKCNAKLGTFDWSGCKSLQTYIWLLV
jgi:dual specificity phosphatase 12